MAVLSQVLLVAFVAGFIVGHYLTGSDKVTTVSAASLVAAEEKEAAEEEAAPAEARAKAEMEEAENVAREETAKGEEAKEAEAKEAEESEGEAGGGEAALTAGKEIFTTNCGSCHTLADAGTSGEVGPNLDELMPEQSLVETQVTNGGGVMPSFTGTLSEEEIVNVAEYVSSVAGQ